MHRILRLATYTPILNPIETIFIRCRLVKLQIIKLKLRIIKFKLFWYKYWRQFNRRISDILGVPKSTVFDVVRKYINSGTIYRKSGSGRPTLLNTNEIKILVELSEANSEKSAKDLALEMKTITQKVISPRTITRNLNKNGLFGRVAKKKPLLSKKNILKRYEISKIFVGMCDEGWRSVIFSDECTFEVYYARKRKIIYRKRGNEFKNSNYHPTDGKVYIRRNGLKLRFLCIEEAELKLLMIEVLVVSSKNSPSIILIILEIVDLVDLRRYVEVNDSNSCTY
ncbi:uncharacterized protein LOC115231247 [Octopus sinensis]|uniref:Uncharacterized protein LOC115231247 n=1 Tax=Octopus sinensis TaxID=2607531 RepID=A0A6P7U4F2_9MOLL|nr:uncharacterized protein LOC115231247 [Octopus sinensis]